MCHCQGVDNEYSLSTIKRVADVVDSLFVQSRKTIRIVDDIKTELYKQ